MLGGSIHMNCPEQANPPRQKADEWLPATSGAWLLMGTAFLLGVMKHLLKLVTIAIQLCEHRCLPTSFAAAKWQFSPQGTGTNSAWASGEISKWSYMRGDPQSSREPGSRYWPQDPARWIHSLSTWSLWGCTLRSCWGQVDGQPLAPQSLLDERNSVPTCGTSR